RSSNWKVVMGGMPRDAAEGAGRPWTSSTMRELDALVLDPSLARPTMSRPSFKKS
ncbi:hypothetical protein DXG01_000906, partial [Tephrocybe rancida]